MPAPHRLRTAGSRNWNPRWRRAPAGKPLCDRGHAECGAAASRRSCRTPALMPRRRWRETCFRCGQSCARARDHSGRTARGRQVQGSGDGLGSHRQGAGKAPSASMASRSSCRWRGARSQSSSGHDRGAFRRCSAGHHRPGAAGGLHDQGPVCCARRWSPWQRQADLHGRVAGTSGFRHGGAGDRRRPDDGRPRPQTLGEIGQGFLD